MANEIGVKLKAEFVKGRCYFENFNNENDVNPKIKRSGLNFFLFNLIGLLLYKLGFAHKINYYDYKDKKGVVYLNRNSFNAWKERHSADRCLDVNLLNKAMSEKKFEEAIKIICDNFSRHGGWNIPLNPDQVMDAAEAQFANLHNKKGILIGIKLCLIGYERSGVIQIDRGGRLFHSEEERQEHEAFRRGLFAFFERKDLFPNVKIFVAH